MDGIYVITKNHDKLELAKDFIISTIKSDEYMAENLNQINKHLAQLDIIGEEIYLPSGKKAAFPLKVYLKGKLGGIRESNVVKKMNHHNGIYEIRLDDNYEHHRIIFFLNSCVLNSYFLTYGFTKNGDPSSDLTDLASTKTLEIHKDLQDNTQKKNYWLGDDSNEFCEI